MCGGRCFRKLCSELGGLNNRYDKFYEVVDSGENYQTTNIPISQTREDTKVHTDSSAKDYNPLYVSLFCVNQGVEGGESYFVDMRSIYDELKLNHKETIDYLSQDFYRDVITPGRENNLENIRQNKFPIIRFNHENLIEFRYMRYWIERAYQKLGCQDELESAHLDTLDSYLESEKYLQRIKLTTNQAIIFNNSYFPHGRDSYIDSPNKKRKMIRVWFNHINF